MADVYDPKRYDPTLFEGTARYYARYRERYDAVFVEMLRREVRPDGSGRLLDVGCGTGNVLVPLATLFAEAVGVDPDAGMLAEAQRKAAEAGAANVRLVQARAEDLPLGLGTFDLITMAASFHWMDRGRVIEILYDMVCDGGALAHISNVTAPGATSTEADPTGWPEVRAIVERYLGSERRAGQGLWHAPGRHEPWFERSRFGRGTTLYAKTGHRRVRTVEDVMGLMFSASGTARHLFGNRVDDFERDVRAALLERQPDGRFPYTSSDIEILLLRK